MKLLEFSAIEEAGNVMKELIITSPCIAHNGMIPSKYTCDGENINPPLRISGIPAGTRSIAIIVEDVDAPIRPWIHWVAWNIPPVEILEENHTTAAQGLNDFKPYSYFGPCPNTGIHHYHFRVFALDIALSISQYLTGRIELEHAMEGHVVAYGELGCRYTRAKNL